MRATNDEAANGSMGAGAASESAAANARIRLLGGLDQQSSLPAPPAAEKALPGVQELLQARICWAATWGNLLLMVPAVLMGPEFCSAKFC